jgi:hypothetical protein
LDKKFIPPFVRTVNSIIGFNGGEFVETNTNTIWNAIPCGGVLNPLAQIYTVLKLSFPFNIIGTWWNKNSGSPFGLPAKNDLSSICHESAKTIWKGIVEVFMLANHPKAKRCFAWSHRDGKNDSDERFVAVLEIPPVTSPETAVKVAIAAEVREKK